MIDSISDMSLYQTMLSSNTSTRSSDLSLSQQETIQNVLSNYDASNLTSSQAQEIVSSFSQANITPSRELANVMESLGFDAKEVGDLAGVSQGGMPPPPPPPPSGEGSEQDSISSVLDILLNGEDDEDSESYASFETILDYTSRIISLNESAKEEVKDILDSYSPENTELSKDDARAVVQNSLSQILSDSSNYNSTSFYG